MVNKDETTQMLRVYTANAENIIVNICKTNSRKHIFQIIHSWLEILDKVPVDLIRDVLYNIEQFREDAFILPDINVKPQRTQQKTGQWQSSRTKSTGMATRSSHATKSFMNTGSASATSSGKTAKGAQSSKSGPKSVQGMSGQVYGAGAKSSGSLEGDETSTKTSGGGSSMTGKNPFAILKASAIADPATCVFPNNFTNLPKVSPPFLEPLDRDSDIYTLVLDLDETLIHNVEVSC